MIRINDEEFYEVPGRCGSCPFLVNYQSQVPGITSFNDGLCHCRMFDEWHHTYREIPRRCSKLFTRALNSGFSEGQNLVIVAK